MRSGWHTLRLMNGDDAAVEALRALIRIPTVSDWDPSREDRTAFEALLAELRERFPRLHATCDVERISGDALLVRWPGRTREAPVVLMAHLDVVPEISYSIGAGGDGTGIEPGLADTIAQQAGQAAAQQEQMGLTPVLLVPGPLRALLSRFLRRALPQLKVLSHSEIPETKTIRVTSLVGAPG